ncbi:MAG: ABC transporter permease subunit, partial [Treponema sp.]|nr:ABC transporter permease subunit [Treponema sp.]
MARNKYIKNALIYLALLLVVVVLMFPLLIVFFTAFKSGTEMTSSLPYALPHSFLYLDNFKTVIQEGSLFRGYANTLFIIAVSLVFNILIGTSAAYILGRFDFKLKKVIMALYFAGIVIPMATTQVATFGIISSLGLFDTPFSLIVLYAGTDIIQLIIYLQFIKNIPFSLDESAMLDGAGYFRIYWSIVF